MRTYLTSSTKKDSLLAPDGSSPWDRRFDNHDQDPQCQLTASAQPLRPRPDRNYSMAPDFAMPLLNTREKQKRKNTTFNSIKLGKRFKVLGDELISDRVVDVRAIEIPQGAPEQLQSSRCTRSNYCVVRMVNLCSLLPPFPSFTPIATSAFPSGGEATCHASRPEPGSSAIPEGPSSR